MSIIDDVPEGGPAMKSMTAVLAVALISSSIADAGTAKKTTPSYRAESSAYVIKRKNAWTFVTENRAFRFVEVPDDQGPLLLLEETYRNEHTDGVEGVQGSATVKAWTLKSDRPRELRWIFREAGNEGTVQHRLFRVTAWGCCDVPVVYSYYSLLTGKKLYVSNSELLEVRGDGDGPRAVRLVAFGYSGMSQLKQPPELQFGTDTRVNQRLSVISSRQYYDAPEMFVSADGKLEKSLDLGGSDLTFVIVLRYGDGLELRVPVEADALHPDRAVLPEGYSLQAEK